MVLMKEVFGTPDHARLSFAVDMDFQLVVSLEKRLDRSLGITIYDDRPTWLSYTRKCVALYFDAWDPSNNETDKRLCRCQITGERGDQSEIVCFNLFDEVDSLLPEAEINERMNVPECKSPRNYFLLSKGILQAYLDLRVCFLFNEATNLFYLRLLDPRLQSEPIFEGSDRMIGEYDRSVLCIPRYSEHPYRTATEILASAAYENAMNLEWLNSRHSASLASRMKKLIPRTVRRSMRRIWRCFGGSHQGQGTTSDDASTGYASVEETINLSDESTTGSQLSDSEIIDSSFFEDGIDKDNFDRISYEDEPSFVREESRTDSFLSIPSFASSHTEDDVNFEHLLQGALRPEDPSTSTLLQSKHEYARLDKTSNCDLWVELAYIEYQQAQKLSMEIASIDSQTCIASSTTTTVAGSDRFGADLLSSHDYSLAKLTERCERLEKLYLEYVRQPLQD
ncbi:hypothetical protein IV203_026173 [Nitzschia inconspicua]|uniref:Uncharacterized protein n=1 Tax=Nitzschia inconspicua TaxID=303405 RepID=A0A9K3LIT3_9STRA|nr:hypothetical protein IV203_026173 [Nitzschia inconspicua]